MHPNSDIAMNTPATAAGWRSRARTRWAWLIGEVLVWAAVVASSALSPSGPAVGSAVMTTVVMLVAVPATATGLVSIHRAARILRTYPWQEFPCTFLRRNQAGTAAVLQPEPGHEVRMLPVVFKTDLSRDGGATPQTLWFAGDLRYGGVISPPGGHRPVRVKRENAKKASHRAAAPVADDLAQQAGLLRGGKATSV